MKLELGVLAGAVLMLVLASPAEAKPRPTVDDPGGDTCFNDPSTDKNCGSVEAGAICYCCYDDGCWICGTTPMPGDECVWDPAYRSGNLPGAGQLSIGPGKGKRPKLPPMRPLTEPKVGPAN